MIVGRSAVVKTGLWHVVTPVLIVAIFLTALVTPRVFCEGILYSLPILTACLSGDRRLVAATTLSCVLLNAVGYFVSASAITVSFAAMNRLAVTAMLFGVGILAAIAVRRFQTVALARDAALAASDERRRTEYLVRVGGRMARLGGWRYDPLTNRIEWSDEVAAIHEYSPGEFPSVEDAIRCYAPAARGRIEEVFRACAEEGIPYDEHFEMVPASGQRKWVRSIGEPVYDEAGRITCVEGALQDVTEVRLLMERVETSQMRFRQLANAMPLFVWTAEPDGTVDYSNQALYDYTGRSEMDLPAAEWTDIIHSDDVPIVEAAWARAVATEAEYTTEFRIWRASDQSYRWHSIRATPIRDEHGVIIKWYGTASEIHEHKQNQEELSRLSKRLISTFESINDGFYVLDHDWRLTYVNAELSRWLNQSKDEILGSVMWELWPHLTGTEIDHQFHRAVETQVPVDFVQYFPRARRWAHVHAYPSDDGLTAYLEDITAQRELEEKQRQSQRMEAIGQLTGGIAHDFNNLLTVILGNTEALVETLNDPEKREAADLAMRAAERGAELTSRLLSFARRQPLDPKPTDINRLIFRMGDLLRRTLAEDVGLDFVLHREGLWHAAVDPSQFENALLNLCINARDAMPSGGRIAIETDNVCLDAARTSSLEDVLPGSYVMLAVTDTGYGMAPHVVERAFEPFFTTKPVGQGSGLGLSMVLGFSKQSGGHVNIQSEIGHGTTIKLYLPKADDREDEESSAECGRSLPPPGAERILLVEDDDMVRDHVAGQLAGLGYRVSAASTGPEAIQFLLRGDEFDLLFTDIIMRGGISGSDLADEARQLRPGLRVLFTSGYAQDSIVHNGRLDSGIDLLTKPYRRQDLAAKLRQALDARDD